MSVLRVSVTLLVLLTIRCIEAHNDACELSVRAGDCSDRIPRWGYSNQEMTCKKFNYSGCGGNKNNFITLQRCQEACFKPLKDECKLAVDHGPCHGRKKRWAYCSKTDVCEIFIYGGCGGNKNNFETRKKCEKACTEGRVNICKFPIRTGPCVNYTTRYAYNRRKGFCQSFVYGGCGGNVNNFESLKECDNTCTEGPSYPCRLSIEPGRCGASFRRFAYCQSSRNCLKFNYGGCEGNDNNFHTMQKCEEKCVEGYPDSCSLPVEPGNCSSKINRYAYDSVFGECRNFTYGGCNGNTNNFETLQNCKESCVQGNTNPCRYAVDQGECTNNLTRYFYSAENQECTNFTYGGCRGNGNNFRSMSECQRACMKGYINICQLATESGNCTNNITRYSYRPESRKCQQFNYGGCLGNENNFDSVEECEEMCSFVNKAACKLEADPGRCQAIIPRFAYNSQTKTCDNFTYGGCGGNDNNFETVKKCEDTCNEDVCKLPAKHGPCNGDLTRFAFSTQDNKCIQFVYGGCGGNENNFKAVEDCEFKCPRNLTNICKLPIEAGNCTNNISRFGYLPSTDTCTNFTYGGCGGNHNNFETKEQCEEKCVEKRQNICRLPKDSGNCTATIPRYNFDKNSNSCEPFNYGGCGGNDNNFETVEKCETTCLKGRQDPCIFPVVTGPCDGEDVRYAYNVEDNLCRKFIYGGCDGNGNNFESQKICEDICVKDFCELPLESGPCTKNITKYGYDKSISQCRQFSYGGCEGNGNNFGNQMECERACFKGYKSPCNLTTEAGNCTETIQRFSYSLTSKKCSNFTFGGCGGNANNFETLNGCEKSCVQGKPNPCGLMVVPGPGRDLIERYGYSNATRKCKLFIYGGHGGNENNFETSAECEATCVRVEKPMCELPVDMGVGNELIERFAYTPGTNKCNNFTYKGSGGNSNNFETIYQCEEDCEKDICKLSPEHGTCEDNLHRYAFNKQTNKCKMFTYGGCGGNENNFKTIEECEERCVKDLCELPLEPGPCSGNLTKYTYDKFNEKCHTFSYSGCGGNGNNFETLDECNKTCIQEKLAPCKIPANVGECESDILRYASNKKTRTCETFLFGGCGGNENNFETLNDCQQSCVEDLCHLPVKSGPCNALMKKYAYREESNECEQFTYGGCYGNRNNYETIEECEEKCLKDQCALKIDAGPCTKNITKFAFDKDTRECTQFIYGGCQGNLNNYETREDCEKACIKDQCKLPADHGPCSQNITRYTYSHKEDECEEFMYGGCEGNVNNYETLEQCGEKCVRDPCKLPMKHGSCEADITRFFYQKSTKQCLPFIYGGCHGNKNNFLTIGACEEKCVRKISAACNQPIVEGDCMGIMPSFGFNITSQKCENFNYGGCGGNENRFDSIKLCQEACIGQ